MRMIGTQTQALNFVAFAEAHPLRHSTGRRRYFDLWEMDSTASTRPARPIDQPSTMVQATSS